MNKKEQTTIQTQFTKSLQRITTIVLSTQFLFSFSKLYYPGLIFNMLIPKSIGFFPFPLSFHLYTSHSKEPGNIQVTIQKPLFSKQQQNNNTLAFDRLLPKSIVFFLLFHRNMSFISIKRRKLKLPYPTFLYLITLTLAF